MPATGPTRPLPISDPAKVRAALADYDERERRVIELRYGLADGRQHSLAKIGQLLGVSGERVRQLEANALERLRSKVGASTHPHPVSRRDPPRPFVRPESPAPARQRFLRPWILVLLWLQPAHGSELKERLVELGMPEADYRFLRGLEDEGLLRSTWVPGGGIGPDRRIYSLTAKGTAELQKDAAALGRVADTLEVFFEHYEPHDQQTG